VRAFSYSGITHFKRKGNKMSEENLDLTPDAPVVQDELTLLKERAAKLGITYGPNIGLETLRKKVNDVLSGDQNNAPAPAEQKTEQLTDRQKKSKARREAIEDALKLVRVNVTCMNPDKKHLEGDFFSVSNSLIGTVTKYVLFDTEEGWHVPNIVLTVLREKQFQAFVTKKLPNGQKTKVGKLVKEYSIDVLDPLTPEELRDLAQRQAMSGSIGD
jgi:hypothetical protein